VTPLDMVAVLLAGVGAGTINTVVGSGTLITFPTLLAFGVPPVTANVSNTIGLVPGSVSGAVGYRKELSGQRERLVRLATASLVGGVLGAVLLLALPAEAFNAIVPVLILLGCLLVLLQPRIAGWVALRHDSRGRTSEHGGLWVWVLVMLTGVYGGYFGAAQGVLLMAVLGIGIHQESLQRLNGTKNVLAAVVNGVAAVVFILVAEHVNWVAAGLIAAGSIIGGQVGATVGRRLPPLALRLVIVAVGLVAVVSFVAS
jgi:uncharacterized membrane protein YfcA